MYEALKERLLWLLKVPPEPTDPMGDVRSLRVFRAAPGYLRYITVAWLITQVGILTGLLFADIPLAIFGSTSTPAAVVEGWMQSPGHCLNIMEPRYRYLGVGHHAGPRSYWTQNFGG